MTPTRINTRTNTHTHSLLLLLCCLHGQTSPDPKQHPFPAQGAVSFDMSKSCPLRHPLLGPLMSNLGDESSMCDASLFSPIA